VRINDFVVFLSTVKIYQTEKLLDKMFCFEV